MKTDQLSTPAAQCMILLTIGFLTYLGTLNAPFLGSEVRTLLDNPAIQDFSKVNDIVRIDQVFNGSLPKLSFAINYLFGHRQPVGYHLVNLAIHLGVGLAFFWVSREWLSVFGVPSTGSGRWIPFAAAGLHLAHPLNSQAVILASSRPILFASLFYLLTFGFAARLLRTYRDNPKKAKGSVDLLFVMACFGMGGTSHPIMVTVPFMAWIFYRFYIRSEKMELEVFALGLIPWIIYLIYQITTPSPDLLADAKVGRSALPALYFLTQIKTLVFYYLPKTLLPMHLSLVPDVHLVNGFGDWTWIAALVILGVLIAGVRRLRSPLALWAALWTVLIFISFYGLGMDYPVASEPRFYLPGMGIYFLAALGLAALADRHPAAGWLRMGIPALLLILTYGRGKDYQSEIALWEATARTAPHHAQVHYELGRAYLNNNQTKQAEQELAATLQFNPKHIRANIDLGKILIHRKEYAKALESYQELIRQGVRTPDVQFNTGLAYLEMNQLKDALSYLESAVAKQPGSALWQATLARAYHRSRKLNDALKHYRISLQIDPNQPVAQNEMGTVFWDLKSFFFADAAFQKANQLDPDYVEALNNLVSSSMLFKQYDQAIAYLNRLLEMDPDNDNAAQLLEAARRIQKQQAAQPPPAPGDFH